MEQKKMSKIRRKKLGAVTKIGRENVLRKKIWSTELKSAEESIKLELDIEWSSVIWEKTLK